MGYCTGRMESTLQEYGASIPDQCCLAGADGCPTLTNMLVIIVGGIPIAMPTVLSVTLALGAFKLAKEGAIVARMSAVEEMAGGSPIALLKPCSTGGGLCGKMYFELFVPIQTNGLYRSEVARSSKTTWTIKRDLCLPRPHLVRCESLRPCQRKSAGVNNMACSVLLLGIPFGRIAIL